MRRHRAPICSSVKDNPGYPEKVSDDNTNNGETKGKKDNSNLRKLRSNSRSVSSTRPLRINRDCLKGIPVAQERVVKRTHPFARRLRSTDTENGIATLQASAQKPRAQMPRITNVRQVVSQSSTPQTTRVLRSHTVTKTITPVQSAKTETSAAIKLSTAIHTSTPASTRTLRSHVSSARGTTDVKSSIPKFAWKLRTRSSVSKPVCNASKDSESKPLRKRRAGEEAESITAAKRVAPKRDLRVAKIEQKEIAKVLVVKKSPRKQPNKADLHSGKEQKPQDDLKLSKPVLEKVDVKTSAVSKEQSENAEPENQQPEVQQANMESKKEEQGRKPDPVVQEQTFDEKKLTPAVKIVDEVSKDVEIHAKDEAVKVADTLVAKESPEEHRSVGNAEKSLVNDEASLVKEPPADVASMAPSKDKSSSDEKAALPESSEADVLAESQRKSEKKSCEKSQFEEEIASTASEVVSKNSGDASSIIVEDISLVKKTTASDNLRETQAFTKISVHATNLAVSSKEKLSSAKVETPTVPLGKTADTNVYDEASAVKDPSTDESPLKTSTEIPPNCESIAVVDISPGEKPTIVEAINQKSAQSLLPTTVIKEQLNPVTTTSPCSESTTVPREQSVFPVKEPELVQAVEHESPQNGLAEPAMVVKEQLNPVTASVCSKPTQDFHERLNGADKNSASKDKQPLSKSAAATKRPASSTAVENGLLVKKKRISSSENGQDKSMIFAVPVTSCAAQRMDVESPVPAASTQAMEVDLGGNLPTNFTFTLASSAPNGQNVSEDMEVGDSGSTQKPTFLFGATQPPSRPVFGCQPFGFGQQGGQASLNSTTSQRFIFGSSQTQSCTHTGSGFNVGNTFGNVPQKPVLFGGVLNQRTSTPVQQMTFGSVPSAPPLPTGGFNQTGSNVFGNLARQNNSTQFSGSFNQIASSYMFGNTQPTSTSSSGPPRKFILTKGARRQNIVKAPFNLNQTSDQSLVFGNGPQLRSQQAFAGFGIERSPTPMESDDLVPVGGLNYQPTNAQNLLRPATIGKMIFGSLQCRQNVNDHPMEEAAPNPLQMVSSGTIPQRNTLSCFAMTTQVRPTIQRTFSLPQITGTAVIPSPPLFLKPARLSAATCARTPRGLTSSINLADISCETFNDTTLEETKCESVEIDKAETLHKIYSSVSSLNSTCSNVSDCQSEIDALIESLSDSMSNCSLEDKPELDDIGKLIEKFKTMNITEN